jgi:hypothetical protein
MVLQRPPQRWIRGYNWSLEHFAACAAEILLPMDDGQKLCIN